MRDAPYRPGGIGPSPAPEGSSIHLACSATKGCLNARLLLAVSLACCLISRFPSTSMAQAERLRELAELPFDKDYPTEKTTTTLEDALYLQRAVQSITRPFPR